MIKTFTQDDVIRYVYEETSGSEHEEIMQAIICDSELQDLYKEIVAVKTQLDESMKTPSDKVTQNILNYSKSLNLLSRK
ncbi:hypothetical protein C900_01513 [Fulvivirga imtechensis AK7]|uniref:Uncharacterized protein n=1 Tax=Fulvivirga imtechensis AK7 TaxID=1237149 RepID=L8JUH1_9BACT|nr:hypothetical protein [Fulvivirga imtechensis]ELR72430.1 hypothetical protein C900_01513 [Fulvivirga imtechensis AK7]